MPCGRTQRYLVVQAVGLYGCMAVYMVEGLKVNHIECSGLQPTH